MSLCDRLINAEQYLASNLLAVDILNGFPSLNKNSILIKKNPN